MKISYCSDIHLEFGSVDLDLFNNSEGADILVLGGDITVAEVFKSRDVNERSAAKARYTHDLWKRVNEKYKVVIYIMGNHEHYHGDFSETEAILRKELEPYENIYFLEKEWMTVDTPEGGLLTIFGATFWTNFNCGDERLMTRAEYCMNDYSAQNTVGGETRYLKATDTYASHNEAFDSLSALLAGIPEDRNVLVCTHHAPTPKSKRPGEFDDSDMHHFYNSDLEEFIKNHPNIRLWTHGHTHWQYEHLIGNTMVVCNPRGYKGHQYIEKLFQLKTFEI